MEFLQVIASIKQLIGQGQLEEAYEQLVKLLDADSQYADLADIARVNQADLYQLKAQTLKGTISSDDARLATNQLTDKALQLIRQLEAGKVTLEEPAAPSHSKALRYYVIGGVSALALAATLWQLLGGRDDSPCPKFSENTELKVMILPFKQTGKEKNVKPEFDIMDGLNDMIDKTSALHGRAIADVNENYDIDKDYPNSAQATEIAQACNVQMLVWGKVNQSSGNDYTVDVRYRLLDAGGVRYAGDTTISRLLKVTEEGGWTRDVKAITQLLFLVLANQMHAPVAAALLPETPPVAAADAFRTDSLAPMDTSTSLVLADYFIQANEVEKAIAEYDKVLAYDPDNSVALLKRGALLMEKKEYSAAARDLESVSLRDKNTAPAVRDLRIKALLKSGQPDKALKEVKTAKQEKGADGVYWNQKDREVNDSLSALQVRRDQMERLAAAQPRDSRLNIEVAKASLGVGDAAGALKHARKVLRRDPKNIEAVQVITDAHLQKGDTAEATQFLHTAERAGVNVKSIRLAPTQKLRLGEKGQ